MAKKSHTSTKKYLPFILVLLVVLVVVIVGFNLFDNKKSTASQIVINASPTPISQTVCPIDIVPPKNYSVQNPINSFFGWSDGGTACTVFLGPNYKYEYEGFSGEQIQLNVYPKDKVFNTSQLQKKHPIGGVEHYSRGSYGGSDDFVIIKKDTQVFEIIWRDESNSKNTEKAVEEIISQL